MSALLRTTQNSIDFNDIHKVTGYSKVLPLVIVEVNANLNEEYNKAIFSCLSFVMDYQLLLG